jgi:uncharacterized membrane protein YqiK
MIGSDAVAIVVLLAILIAIAVYLLHWLYRRSSKDQSFVRTGLGGEKVVMGGGALVVPIVHDITLVNMNAIPVEIRRAGEHSLITRNKLRIDVVAEFFVRVIPTRDGISAAARTLGARMRDPLELKEIVQSRFADALSAMASNMTMEEIHANRAKFMSEVANIAATKLSSNGLELENASLTGLNQTDIAVFNPANAFDAEGLLQLTEQIEERRKLRNEIENATRVSIKQRDFEAEQRALEIDRDLEYARIEQLRAIEIRRAAQLAEIEQERANSAIAIHSAKTRAEEENERTAIAKNRAIEAERINTANELRALEIEREKDAELTDIRSKAALESQRIVTRQQIEAERIENDRKVREQEILSRQAVSISETTAAAQVDQTRIENEKQVESARIETTKLIELLAVDRDKEIRIRNEVAGSEQERAAIARRHAIEMERLRRDEEIRAQEIAKNHKIRIAETQAFRETEDAQIAANREIDQMRIAARRFIDRFEIEQQKEIEIVDKERLIAVINKSIEEAVAKTEVANALKSLASAEEQVITARAEEAADRTKRVELIDARTKAERDALRVVSSARAEREVSEERAQGIIAEAGAAEVRYAKEAAGARMLNESENMRTDASRRSAIYEHLVKTLPNIIRETVKPLEKIESIKILQVDGVPGLNSPSERGGGDGGSPDNITDRVVNSAMKYRTQVAFVDGLMKDLGLPVDKLGGAGGISFRNFPGPSPTKGSGGGGSGKDDD